jgi:hypothetical protein
MPSRRIPLTAFALLIPLLAGAPAASAQRADSVAVVVRFGTDTLALEQWVRTADRVEAVSVTRSPSTAVNRWAVRLDADGRVTHVVTDECATAVQPAGAIPTAPGFYAPQALALLQASRARDTMVVVRMLAGANVQEFRVRRIGPDLFELRNPSGAVTARARLATDGRLIFLEAGPSITVERVAWFDIDLWARAFEARDARGAGFGPLSGRDTARVHSAGASITIDYGQPAARGRTVFGGVVPYGAVWRTGANDATQLIVDRAVRIGDVRVEPGTYSLYTVPGRDRWQLGINRGTGMGAAMSPDAAQDVGRATMSVRALPEHVERFTIVLEPAANGAVLRMRWETTEASVPIIVEN